VRVWIDECLSPTLVAATQVRFEATCNEYRGMLHATDRELFAVLSREEWVLVTNNESDFRALTREDGIHPGLIVLPQRTRAKQGLMLTAVLDYIERSCAAAGLSAASWMTSKVIEYHDLTDTITAHDWPPNS
jgi:predicted nuclease of predicted toxin-antitoxin system